MYNLLVSISASVAAFAIFWFSLKGSDYRPVAFVVALGLFFALNYFLSKRVIKKVEALMAHVSRDLQNQRFDKAIKTLKSGFSLGKWQFFVKSQLNAQIGSIYYLMRDDENAFAYLKEGFSKHWVAMGMLAVIYMKRKQKELMAETFEKAVKGSPKESLIWSLYAYCLLKEGDREKALEVLARGLKKIPDDDKLKANMTAVANKEKMKMKNYGDMWTQFYLEKVPPAAGQKIPHYLQALSGGRRRIIRR
jgi:tetratricopeptide (TPR) repeat protein